MLTKTRDVSMIVLVAILLFSSASARAQFLHVSCFMEGLPVTCKSTLHRLPQGETPFNIDKPGLLNATVNAPLLDWKLSDILEGLVSFIIGFFCLIFILFMPCSIILVPYYIIKILWKALCILWEALCALPHFFKRFTAKLTAKHISPELPYVSGAPEGYAYVDLGLPSGVKWATCNVGAGAASDYGDYYAWGETTAKKEYNEDNCDTYGMNLKDIGGNVALDVARANWGGTWRLPTAEECQELIDNCTWTWISQGGHEGYKVTSKKNGSSIFLPAAGWRGSSLNLAGKYGYYWSSSPNGSYSKYARSLYFGSSGHLTHWSYRSYGFSVRPVSE